MRAKPHDLDRTRDISVAVYKLRLGLADTEQMLAKDGPEKLRQRAASYDALTRAYLTAIGPPKRRKAKP
jgi:hypothetical protein